MNWVVLRIPNCLRFIVLMDCILLLEEQACKQKGENPENPTPNLFDFG